jgi:hypothetical protein
VCEKVLIEEIVGRPEWRWFKQEMWEFQSVTDAEFVKTL